MARLPRSALFDRSHGPLLGLGVAMELIYLQDLVRRFPVLQYYRGPYIDMGQITGHTRSGLLAYMVTFGALFVLYGLAWWAVQGRNDRGTLSIVLGFGALFCVTMVFVYPVTALDVFAYIDQSLVMVQYHQNPIFTPAATFGRDPLMSLSDGWASQGSPYGPLGIVIDAVPTVLVGRNLLANLMLLKLLFSAMVLAEAFLVYRILQAVGPRWAVSGALLIAWSPYILFEVSANAHNDIAVMLFALLALQSMVEGELTTGPVLLMASALVKYATVLLLPLFLVYGLARHRSWTARVRYCAITLLSMLAVVVVVYAPFWRGVHTLDALQFQNQRYLYSWSTVLSNLTGNGVSLPQAALIGRILYVPVYLYALWLSTRHPPVALLRACFLAMFGFFLLANTNFLYWYGLSAFFLAAAVPAFPERLCAFLMACGIEIVTVALNIYVWVLVGVTPENFRPLNNVSYLSMFVLPALALVALTALGEGSALRSRFLRSSRAATLPERTG